MSSRTESTDTTHVMHQTNVEPPEISNRWTWLKCRLASVVKHGTTTLASNFQESIKAASRISAMHDLLKSKSRLKGGGEMI
uniref:Uncharacterized protein n=1 Tax=Salix viminalis TaxID=40686 RepID=A0A6N2N9S4_SALVM